MRKPTARHYFFKRFNILQRNNEQVIQKQGREYFYDVRVSSLFID